MFCLDFAAAFIVHFQLASRFDLSTQSHPLFTFSSGCLSGFTAAVALYPFDIVRQMTVAPGTSHFAFSTIPFMTAYLGIYMLQPQVERQQKPFKNKLAWAFASTSVAAAVEFPFDKAKHSMAGSLRAAALANAFRIPLGSLMLIAYVTRFTCCNFVTLCAVMIRFCLPEMIVGRGRPSESLRRACLAPPHELPTPYRLAEFECFSFPSLSAAVSSLWGLDRRMHAHFFPTHTTPLILLVLA
jgi:hypothetical protein